MKTIRVEMICIGTELLSGKVNTHTAFLSEKLALLGLSIAREHTVSDDPRLMMETFKEAFSRADIIFAAGGLGPTFDDLTRDVWSKVVRCPLVTDPRLIADIEGKFKRRGIPMPPANRRQALVLKGADVIANPNGTAPGQYLRIGSKTVILLPGPSRELYPMVDDYVLPRLKRELKIQHAIQKTFLMAGIPESKIDHLIRPVIDRYPKPKQCEIIYGILASQSIISVKFRVVGCEQPVVHKAADELCVLLKKRLKPFLFGEDDDTLPGVIGKILKATKKTLALAESCTGGLIGQMITEQPGSSAYFLEDMVTYSNESKRKRLRISRASLEKPGAVSAEVAREMAVNLRKISGADYTISVTGIAGPDGGTEKKPVGLVYIGFSGPQRTVVHRFHFAGDRAWIRHRASHMALDILRRELNK